MDESKLAAAIDILKRQDNAGKPYAQARQLLLQKGYTENQIIQAAYQVPYDGKPNATPETHPVQRFYQQHPDVADQAAKLLLDNLAVQERDKLVAYSAAAEFGDAHSRAYYSSLAASEIDFPLFKFLGLNIVAAIIVIKYPRFSIISVIVTIITNLVFAVYWWRSWRRVSPRK